MRNMNRVILIAFGIFLSSIELKAQDFGLKGGFVIATINGQETASFKPGMQIGGYKLFGASDQLHVQMEALFSQKGSWNWDNSNPNNINLYYFDFAIMFGVYLNEKFTINVGIQPSLFLGGSYKYTLNGQEQSKGLRGKVSDMDYATIFGLEYKFNDTYSFGGRYNYSFVPLQSYNNEFSDKNELPTSQLVQFYAKVKFDKVIDWIKLIKRN